MTAPAIDLGSIVGAGYTNGTPAAGPPLTVGMMSTTHNDEAIIIVVGCDAYVGGTPSNYATVASITGGGLTFARRAGTVLSGTQYISNGAGLAYAGGLNLEYLWAHAPTQLVNVVFDITLNSTVSSAARVEIVGFGVSNLATPASPWDVNGALPAVASAVTGQATVAATTTGTNDLLLGFLGYDLDGFASFSDDGTPAQTSGWIGVALPSSSGSPGPPYTTPSLLIGVERLTVSAPQVARDATWPITQPNTINANIQIADALVGPGAGPPPASIFYMDNVVVTSLGTESPCTALNFTTPPPVAQSPSLGLRWSDTRGQTFGNAVPQQFSTDPLSSYQWNRTGYARDRVFELFWSAAFKTALNGAFIDVRTMKS